MHFAPHSGMVNAATEPTTTTKQQQQIGRRAATPLTHTVAAAPAIATATARQQQQLQQHHFQYQFKLMPHSKFLHAMEYIGASPSNAFVPACTFFRYHGRFHSAADACDYADDDVGDEVTAGRSKPWAWGVCKVSSGAYSQCPHAKEHNDGAT